VEDEEYQDDMLLSSVDMMRLVEANGQTQLCCLALVNNIS
jgi:hypothetical protein